MIRARTIRCLTSIAVLCFVALAGRLEAGSLSLMPESSARGSDQQCLVAAGEEEAEALFQQGQSEFSHRAIGARGAVAASGPTDRALACYKEALALAPDRFDVRVAWLHALMFRGEYVARTEDDKKAAFLEGRDLFERSLDLLGQKLGQDVRQLSPEDLDKRLGRAPEARSLFFYGALHWGLWAEYYGTMAAVRQGVAKRIRTLAEIVLAVTPEIDEGGAHRLMGRIHFLTPRVPLVTSRWVDRDRALSELEQALVKGPDNPLNLAFLAEAVNDIGRDPVRAKALITRAVSARPRVDRLVEDRGAIERAKSIEKELGL